MTLVRKKKPPIILLQASTLVSTLLGGSNHADSDDDGPRGVLDYGKALMDYLLDMYYSGTFSAKTLCTICFYLAGLGVVEAKQFALSPRSQTGKFQSKVDDALSWNKD